MTFYRVCMYKLKMKIINLISFVKLEYLKGTREV